MQERRRIVVYDCTKSIWRSGINIPEEVIDQYPYVIGLLDEWFRGEIIKTEDHYSKWKWSMCEPLREWLDENSFEYYFVNPSTHGLLCLKDKESLMRFKLVWM